MPVRRLGSIINSVFLYRLSAAAVREDAPRVRTGARLDKKITTALAASRFAAGPLARLASRSCMWYVMSAVRNIPTPRGVMGSIIYR